MRVTYGLSEETYFLENNKRVSYGIVAYFDAENNGSANIVASVHDITSDEKKIAELVLLCNSLELSVVHLSDVVEDFFAS